MRADYGAELAGCNALIRMLRERMEGTESDNKSLAASDRAHNSAHAPPATRTWHAERRERKGRPEEACPADRLAAPRAGALVTRARRTW